MPPATDTNDLKLVGYKHFMPQMSRRFAWGLGMCPIGKSDQSTGHHVSASYVIQIGDIKLMFTVPYALETEKAFDAVSAMPGYDLVFAQKFVMKHGVVEPHTLTDKGSGKTTTVSEVKLYGDVVIRWGSGNIAGPFVPDYQKCDSVPDVNIGIKRLDHCVGNVPNLLEAVKYISDFTGFHEFAEFTAEDVGTLDSGLNNLVLASNNEMVLLPVNEPTFGTKHKSQI
ncbi:putative glyoxalase/Bleomycin resistance protein/Dihydroxybiphenyl dioxygenase [Plasmopara halstedii]